MKKIKKVYPKEVLLEQYNYEVRLYEQYGSRNTITFDEWLEIKGLSYEIKEQKEDKGF